MEGRTMANLMEAKRLAEGILWSKGMSDWKVEFSNTRRIAGQCFYGAKTIKFSRHLAAAASEDAVYNTILHEIAHAMTPGAGHGPRWKATFLMLGGNGETRSSLYSGAIEEVAKWRLECPTTGKTLGHVHRKGARLARSLCKCCAQPPLWKANR
jgi:predicted SprT family Zn-dependent metalloprotease